MIRWNSEYGESELRIAKEHPEASIYSVGPSETAANDFIESVSEEGVTNAWRFISSYSKQIADHIHKSPELFRYQVWFLDYYDFRLSHLTRSSNLLLSNHQFISIQLALH